MLVGVEHLAGARGGLSERIDAPRQEIVSDGWGRGGEPEGIENIPLERFVIAPVAHAHEVQRLIARTLY